MTYSALDSFFGVEKKPTALSQTCILCHKDIRKNDLRVRAQCGAAHAGMGCTVSFIYGHLSCWLEAVQHEFKRLGFPIVISAKAKLKLKKIKHQIKKEYLIEALKS